MILHRHLIFVDFLAKDQSRCKIVKLGWEKFFLKKCIYWKWTTTKIMSLYGKHFNLIYSFLWVLLYSVVEPAMGITTHLVQMKHVFVILWKYLLAGFIESTKRIWTLTFSFRVNPFSGWLLWELVGINSSIGIRDPPSTISNEGTFLQDFTTL